MLRTKPEWMYDLLAKWHSDFRNVMLPGTSKTAGEVSGAILDHFALLRDDALASEADAETFARHAKEADSDCDGLAEALEHAIAVLETAKAFVGDVVGSVPETYQTAIDRGNAALGRGAPS